MAETKNTKNYFEELNSVDVNKKVEKKNGLSYLSWAYAWGELKKKFPEANYTIYENQMGWFYFTDGKTAWVKTGVTVNGIEHIEYLPIMNNRNQSIPVGNITSFDVNKAIQRSLTKAVARHGLGLYIYAGEDLPETTSEQTPAPAPAPAKRTPARQQKPNPENAPSEQQDQGLIESLEEQYSMPTMPLPLGFINHEGPTWRDTLRETINKYQLDGAAIINACGLNKNSTELDYFNAYNYAQSLLLERPND